jgi:hypothetical protein
MIDDRIYRFCHDRRLREEGRYPPGGLRSASLHSGPSHNLLRPACRGTRILRAPRPCPCVRGWTRLREGISLPPDASSILLSYPKSHDTGIFLPYKQFDGPRFTMPSSLPTGEHPGTGQFTPHVTPCRVSFQRENTRHRTILSARFTLVASFSNS